MVHLYGEKIQQDVAVMMHLCTRAQAEGELWTQSREASFHVGAGVKLFVNLNTVRGMNDKQCLSSCDRLS